MNSPQKTTQLLGFADIRALRGGWETGGSRCGASHIEGVTIGVLSRLISRSLSPRIGGDRTWLRGGDKVQFGPCHLCLA